MHWLGPVSVQCIHVDAPANGSQMAGRQMVVPRSPPAPLISGRPVGRTHPSRSHHHHIRAAKEQSAGRPGRWLVSAGWLVVRYLPGSKLHAACNQPASQPASGVTLQLTKPHSSWLRAIICCFVLKWGPETCDRGPKHGLFHKKYKPRSLVAKQN